MITTSSRPVLQEALAHSVAFVILCCSISFAAGFSLGIWLQQLNQPALHPAAQEHQLAAAQEAWEEEVASGRWSEPSPVEPLFSGSWWDLVDPSELDEAERELPLRWAV